ncbi:MAG: hypothetical protein PWQ96_293 [Clostridia bacterium]|jgi:hypothetical protein|nr:hypothetical protein [Clostridia bacterium]
MPRCLNCGNVTIFYNSSYKSIPQLHDSVGFAAYFSEDGLVRHIENRNAPHEIVENAWKSPEGHFDTCSMCGSQNIIWT